MHRFIVPILLAMAFTVHGQAQRQESVGEVSYVTSQNVYVRFTTTSGIETGDTLFILKEGELRPALRVTNLSSISAVCEPLGEGVFQVGQQITAKTRIPEQLGEPLEIMPEPVVAEPPPPAVQESAAEPAEEGRELKKKQLISGRIGVTSYSNITSQEEGGSQRMRYVFSLDAAHIKGSDLSLETYIVFSHRDEQWDQIKANVYEGLKFYGLAVNYDIGPNTSLSLGRKFNRRISSMGAVDGFQLEQRFGDFSAGAILGSRPDYEDYSFNASLFQAGAYFSHEKHRKKKYIQTTVAIVEQQDSGKTDRRFAYVQHMNRLLQKVYLFASGEFDLYKLSPEYKKESTFSLTNAFVSLRYNPFTRLRLSASYSARNNIIYYERYERSFIDKLLALETIQGYRLGASYRPWNKLLLGIRAGYRSRPEDSKASRNLYAYITNSEVPYIKATLTLSATLLETSYINGKVYGLSLSRDIIARKIYASAGYRYTDYSLYNDEIQVLQHIAEASLSWRVIRNLVFSVSNEATFGEDNDYHRLFISLRKRF